MKCAKGGLLMKDVMLDRAKEIYDESLKGSYYPHETAKLLGDLIDRVSSESRTKPSLRSYTTQELLVEVMVRVGKVVD